MLSMLYLTITMRRITELMNAQDKENQEDDSGDNKEYSVFVKNASFS